MMRLQGTDRHGWHEELRGLGYRCDEKAKALDGYGWPEQEVLASSKMDRSLEETEEMNHSKFTLCFPSQILIFLRIPELPMIHSIYAFLIFDFLHSTTKPL
jgi:hypothetical protein